MSDAANYDVLLGNDFLGPIRADISYSRSVLEYDGNEGGRHTVPVIITRGELLDLLTPLDVHVASGRFSSGRARSNVLTPGGSPGPPGLLNAAAASATVAESATTTTAACRRQHFADSS